MLERLPSRGRAHGAAIRVAWLVLGCVFLFPGIHKLHTSGIDWITSDNLRNQMWWKWAQDPSLQPSFRVDRHPWLLHFGAGATVVFELAFLPLVFHPRTRALAVIAALAFHASTEWLMGIRFTVLWVTYGVFVPWEALYRRARGAVPEVSSRIVRSVRAIAIVGGLLLSGIVAAGALGIVNGYPFACFPTFEWIVEDHMPELEIAVVDADGRERVLERDLWRDPGPREWAIEWSVVGAYGGFVPGRAEAFVRGRIAQRPELAAAVAGAREIRLAHVEITIDPDRRGEGVEREELLSLAP